jgi:hypothetical protein
MTPLIGIEGALDLEFIRNFTYQGFALRQDTVFHPACKVAHFFPVELHRATQGHGRQFLRALPCGRVGLLVLLDIRPLRG